MQIQKPQRGNLRILTIGHSDHPLEHFLGLLKLHSVEVIADTRSYPYSNFAPQYDQEPLRGALVNAGFQYVHLGLELGGRPEGDQYYDSEGHVLYGKVAGSDQFKAGIVRLEQGIRKYNVALLCAEENPAHCHRRLLIGRVLLKDGIEIEHIRGDGRLQSETELSQQLNSTAPQMNLFKETEGSEWKSIPSVLRRRRQSSSSAH
jgi:uncharacterized protein (DUF488 family)